MEGLKLSLEMSSPLFTQARKNVEGSMFVVKRCVRSRCGTIVLCIVTIVQFNVTIVLFHVTFVQLIVTVVLFWVTTV